MWPGMHLVHNSAKLKIFNLPKHIQLLRWGLSASAGQVGRLPSDPLVGELLWLTDQRSDGGPDTKRRLDRRRAAVLTALRLELSWGVWPRYSV
jgi:hypothetical protein